MRFDTSRNQEATILCYNALIKHDYAQRDHDDDVVMGEDGQSAEPESEDDLSEDEDSDEIDPLLATAVANGDKHLQYYFKRRRAGESPFCTTMLEYQKNGVF